MAHWPMKKRFDSGGDPGHVTLGLRLSFSITYKYPATLGMFHPALVL